MLLEVTGLDRQVAIIGTYASVDTAFSIFSEISTVDSAYSVNGSIERLCGKTS
jgi:hypothetical protein